MKTKYIRLIIEILAWSVFIGFPFLIVPSLGPYLGEGLLLPVLKGVIITHSLLIVFYYFNSYYALQKFYFTRRYAVYFSMVIACLLLVILILQTNKNYNPIASSSFRYSNVIFVFSIVLRFLMVFLLSLGFSSYQRLKKAEEEKLKTELSYLKAQINPHFLFNTLNSIYALTVKKSDSAPESVTKLAAIMRYVITDAMQDFVPLEKEINYVTSYIELEKLRLTSKVKLNYSVAGNMSGKQIAPLIFIPLVENAFKHGVSTVEDSEIEIKIAVSEEQLSLCIQNSKIRPDKTNNNGLGLDNVKKRLDLLYGGKHTLTINDKEKDFSVNLVMSLK